MVFNKKINQLKKINKKHATLSPTTENIFYVEFQ